MPILHLPRELFNRIIHDLVGSARLTSTLPMRHVCGESRQVASEKICLTVLVMFNDSILEDMLKRISRLGFTSIFARPEHAKLFDLHGGAQSLKSNALTPLLQRAIPAAAAAIGRIQIVHEITSGPADPYKASCELFPSALAASVAYSQNKVLALMLLWKQKKVKEKPETASWKETRAAARAIGQALRVTIRMHETKVANVIFTFFSDNEPYRRLMALWCGEQLCRDCMRYGNAYLMYGAFAYEHAGNYDPSNLDRGQKFTASTTDFEFLLEYGHKNSLNILIKDTLLDPGADMVKTALDKCSRDVARILLENGANPNAPLKGLKGRTVLWHVASRSISKTSNFYYSMAPIRIMKTRTSRR
ncbi:hypothetical protein EK21DRAFT_92081 [Setomelanomma holmii]|uniref:Uncharacterized protein n=1 Tax=Setomelanomma holmii TaxID=210430 RepID=A0A9P4LK99_9PLEO|nr:hypothetical protein EK21DRAFT_92081 [Setomelanomma holmii]